MKSTYVGLTMPGGAIRGHLGHSQRFTTSTFYLLQNISVIQKKPAPMSRRPPPPPPAPGTASLLSASKDLPILGISRRWSPTPRGHS